MISVGVFIVARDLGDGVDALCQRRGKALFLRDALVATLRGLELLGYLEGYLRAEVIACPFLRRHSLLTQSTRSHVLLCRDLSSAVHGKLLSFCGSVSRARIMLLGRPLLNAS